MHFSYWVSGQPRNVLFPFLFVCLFWKGKRWKNKFVNNTARLGSDIGPAQHMTGTKLLQKGKDEEGRMGIMKGGTEGGSEGEPVVQKIAGARTAARLY